MLFGSNTFLFMEGGGGGRGAQFGVIQNILMPLGVWEENVFNKKNSPSSLMDK